MYSAIVVLGLAAMLGSLCVVDGHFTPIDIMTDDDFRDWVKPPNKQTVQRMLIDRILKVMDPRYNPCDDFYKFSCGNYATVALKAYEASQTLMETEFQGNRAIKMILTNSGRGYSSSRIERKARDFFDSCMHGQGRLSSIDEVMESFGSWPALDPYWRESDFDWMKTLAAIYHYDSSTLFELDMGAGDNGRNEMEIMVLLLNATLRENDPVQPVDIVRKSYQDLLTNSKVPRQYIEGMAQRVHSFKSQLHKTLHDSMRTLRDYRQGVPIHTIQRQVPSCDLGRLVALISGQEVDTSKSVALPSVKYVEGICRLLRNTDKQTIADYLFLTLYTKVVSDMEEYNSNDNEQDLTNFCVGVTMKVAQPLLAKVYIDEFLTPEVRQDLANMTHSIHAFAVEMMRTQTSWLDERSRYRAIKKMEAPLMFLVAPEYMLSEEKVLQRYADVSIDPSNYMHNLKELRRRKFLNEYGIHGKSRHFYELEPLDMNPAFAGYFRGFMMLQAVVHQLPLFNNYAPSFYKFGGMMAIIGHELMHNFDVNFIARDENGREQEWMSPNLALSHAFRSECFYSQFENYKLANTDIHVAGALTLAENLADNDGIKIAFKLYKKWMAENPDIVKQEQIDYAPLQLTHEQLFFLTYGQTWCDTKSLAHLIYQIKTDVHSPNMFRVIGGVSNSYDFAEVYQCPPNFKMNPSEKCRYFFD